MKIMPLAFCLGIAVSGCTSQQDKAAQQQAQKEQLQLAIKKIDVVCRDKYPMGTPGALIKRKQCQQLSIESLELPQK